MKIAIKATTFHEQFLVAVAEACGDIDPLIISEHMSVAEAADELATRRARVLLCDHSDAQKCHLLAMQATCDHMVTLTVVPVMSGMILTTCP